MTGADTSGPPAAATSHWYHQPVAWLGVLIFLASLAGCVWLIIASLRYDERALPGSGEQLLKMPLERVPQAGDRPPHEPQLPEEKVAADGAVMEGSGIEGAGLKSGSGTNNP